MRAEIMTWSQLSKAGCEDRVILFDGGLVTVRGMRDVNNTPGVPAKYYMSYTTPWKSLRNKLVQGSRLVAVLESGEEE
jgi:hypothetical protein